MAHHLQPYRADVGEFVGEGLRHVVAVAVPLQKLRWKHGNVDFSGNLTGVT